MNQSAKPKITGLLTIFSGLMILSSFFYYLTINPVEEKLVKVAENTSPADPFSFRATVKPNRTAEIRFSTGSTKLHDAVESSSTQSEYTIVDYEIKDANHTILQDQAFIFIASDRTHTSPQFIPKTDEITIVVTSKNTNYPHSVSVYSEIVSRVFTIVVFYLANLAFIIGFYMLLLKNQPTTPGNRYLRVWSIVGGVVTLTIFILWSVPLLSSYSFGKSTMSTKTYETLVLSGICFWPVFFFLALKDFLWLLLGNRKNLKKVDP